MRILAGVVAALAVGLTTVTTATAQADAVMAAKSPACATGQENERTVWGVCNPPAKKHKITVDVVHKGTGKRSSRESAWVRSPNWARITVSKDYRIVYSSLKIKFVTK